MWFHRKPRMCCAQAAVNPRPGVVGESILRAGDVGYAPRGAPHYFKNVGCTDAFVLLIFDAGIFNTLDVTHVTADLPAQVRPASCCSSAPDTMLLHRCPLCLTVSFSTYGLVL